MTQLTFGCDETEHNDQGDQRQCNRSSGIPFRLPGLENSGGKTRNTQQFDGSKFVHDLHSHQGDPRTDGWQGNRQGNATEGLPRPNAEASAGFKLAATTDGEAFGAQQKHVGISTERHHGDAPADAVDEKSAATAQVDQRGREQISGGCQGDQLGDA